ncbi:hypothetical protein OEA41_001630 [Lepraria neglecta]|uniref:Thaumatin-like protein n=1 Tax=Lepraria neglecta TaxID=209136 RepID=A0AAD9ZB20_9LECA|nr:hypothetical protein OEA41_001630 [Lepraria neglecta]
MLTPVRVIALAFALAAPLIAANVEITSAPYIAVDVESASAPLVAANVESTSASLIAANIESTSADHGRDHERTTSVVQSKPTSAIPGRDHEMTTSVINGKPTPAIPSKTAPSSFQRVTTTIVHSEATTAVVQGVPTSRPVHEEVIKPTTGPSLEYSGYVTLSIVNKYGPGLSMALTSDVAAPSAIGNPKRAALGNSTKILFPSGWSGLMDIAPIMDKSSSKIEASYSKSVYVDVSYVDGCTVPITCSCGEKIITGCNVELFNTTGACPDDGPDPICYNPSAFLDDGPTHPFFVPCRAASYTYSKDDLPIRGCAKSPIECCVGAECPANPNQPNEILKAKLKEEKAGSIFGRLTRRHGE